MGEVILTPEEEANWPKAQADGATREAFVTEMLGKRPASQTGFAVTMGGGNRPAEAATGTVLTPSEIPGHTHNGPAAVREGATIPLAVDEAAQAANPDYITLQDGRTAYVKTQTGHIIPKARQIMSEDGDNFTDCLAALSTTIDGRPIVIEDLYALPLKDCMRIIGRFNAKNGL